MWRGRFARRIPESLAAGLFISFVSVDNHHRPGRLFHCRPCTHGASSVAANLENEDRFRIVDKDKVTIALVADGHGSHQVSQFVCERLPEEIFQSLIVPSRTKDEVRQGTIDPNSTSALINSFVRVDEALRTSVYSGDSPIQCFEGSCAIAAVIQESKVYVANTGDSRAFLISRNTFEDSIPKTNYPSEAEVEETTTMPYGDQVPLGTTWVSELHTADSPYEQSRLRSLHPLEKDVVHCRQKIVEIDSSGTIVSTKWGACYVKGRLQPTRAFGDFYLKDEKAVEICPPEFADLIPNHDVFTPPYIEAIPTVKEFVREPGSVLVLASDGLWDYVSPSIVTETVSEGFRSGRNCAEIADDLVTVALTIASEATGGEISPEELREMQRGFERRNIHDDITVVVLAL